MEYIGVAIVAMVRAMIWLNANPTAQIAVVAGEAVAACGAMAWAWRRN